MKEEIKVKLSKKIIGDIRKISRKEELDFQSTVRMLLAKELKKKTLGKNTKA
jgi:hypothetical protein